jgi:hypothetical protein
MASDAENTTHFAYAVDSGDPKLNDKICERLGTDAFILANVKLVLSPLDQWTADVHAIDAVACKVTFKLTGLLDTGSANLGLVARILIKQTGGGGRALRASCLMRRLASASTGTKNGVSAWRTSTSTSPASTPTTTTCTTSWV